MTRIGTVFVALALLALGPAPGAHAAVKATYVGIVISGHGTGCVKWHSGITGDEILNDVASVHYRRDGLIDQIDGQPSPPHADSTHYWSYWHDTGSTWTYSGTGASGSTPAAGTVEGWSYVPGASSASPPAQSASGLYAALCGNRDPRPATSPTHRRSVSKPAPRVSASPSSAGQRGAAAPVSRAARTTSGPVAPGSSGTSTLATTARRSATAGSSPSGTVGASGSTSAGRPASVDATPASSAAKPANGSVLPVILGLALALLLGGGAGWTVLRRRRAEGADH